MPITRDPASVLAAAACRPLVMLAPTRGRPRAARALVQAFEATQSGQASLVLAVDEDDPELPRYLDLDWPDTIVGSRLRLGGTLNLLGPAAVGAGAWAVGFLGDDHRPRTSDWDVEFLAALRGMGSGVVYGDDGFQHENIPTAVAITADLIHALGWMVPPGMVHLYLDDWWKRLGADLDRLMYLPHVLIEHMHPVAGKGEWDPGYAEVNSAQRYAEDGALLERFLATSWPNLRRLLMTVSRTGAAAEVES